MNSKKPNFRANQLKPSSKPVKQMKIKQTHKAKTKRNGKKKKKKRETDSTIEFEALHFWVLQYSSSC